jgi:hypothetical protein
MPAVLALLTGRLDGDAVRAIRPSQGIRPIGAGGADDKVYSTFGFSRLLT